MGDLTEVEHSCGRQGFNAHIDKCGGCEYERLIDEGYPEDSATILATLEYLSSGPPSATGPIKNFLAKELERKYKELKPKKKRKK